MSKRKNLLILVILVMAIVAGATLASFTTRTEVKTVIDIGRVKVDFAKYDVATAVVMPGVPVSSTVAIKNTGSTDAYVRVSFAPGWTQASTGAASSAIESELTGNGWRKATEKGVIYYYYEEPVKANGTTGELSGNVTIRGDLTGNEIAGQDLDFDVKVEAIQAQAVSLNFGGANSENSSVWPKDADIIANTK